MISFHLHNFINIFKTNRWSMQRNVQTITRKVNNALKSWNKLTVLQPIRANLASLIRYAKVFN